MVNGNLVTLMAQLGDVGLTVGMMMVDGDPLELVIWTWITAALGRLQLEALADRLVDRETLQ